LPTIEQITQKLESGEINYKCTVLRKLIKSSKDYSQVEKVVFCAEDKQVKSFQKRKQKHEKS